MRPEEEIRALEEIIQEILAGMQEALQSGERLSDEIQGRIADEINFTTDRIDQLRGEIAERPPLEPEQPTPGEGPQPLGIDLLWQLANGNEDAFVSYLRTVPDPALNALLRNPTQLQQTISGLQRRMPPGQQPSEDGIPHADLNSSNIFGFRFNRNNGRLLVRFQNGNVYGYSGIPEGVFKVFQQGAVPAKTSGSNDKGVWFKGKIPSLGAAFYELIRKGNYPYQKLS